LIRVLPTESEPLKAFLSEDGAREIG